MITVQDFQNLPSSWLNLANLYDSKSVKTVCFSLIEMGFSVVCNARDLRWEDHIVGKNRTWKGE